MKKGKLKFSHDFVFAPIEFSALDNVVEDFGIGDEIIFRSSRIIIKHNFGDRYLYSCIEKV